MKNPKKSKEGSESKEKFKCKEILQNFEARKERGKNRRNIRTSGMW